MLVSTRSETWPDPDTCCHVSPTFRFSRLRSLNLSNNHLGQFPLAICDIPTLTEVNLSCNYLLSVPGSVGAMAK